MEDVEGVRVNGELLKVFKFADDQGTVAQTIKGLQTTSDALSKTYGNINWKDHNTDEYV